MASICTTIKPIEALERTFQLVLSPEELQQIVDSMAELRIFRYAPYHTILPSTLEKLLSDALKEEPPRPGEVIPCDPPAPTRVWKWFR
jgi:hypothetical protein